MKRLFWLVLPFLAIAILVAVLIYLTRGHNMAVFNPNGLIAEKERDLIYLASGLMAIILIPVYYLIFSIAWKYREDNHKARYTPDWDSNSWLEAIWWGVPCIIIGILCVVTWQSSHALDPYKPLASDKAPVHVQVVALDWKWLFIYPEEGIASVNLLEIPVDRPIEFSITSDAPMNSFWIPQLGGQVYAMAGMTTKLHLEADKIGENRGSSANISGAGFADMNFIAKAVSEDEYRGWIDQVKSSSEDLTTETYNLLARPNIVKKPITYTKVSKELFDDIIMKYMMPASHKGMTIGEKEYSKNEH